MQQYPTCGSLETSWQLNFSLPTQGWAVLSQACGFSRAEPRPEWDKQDRRLVRRAVQRENDKDGEAVRSEEMILLWGVVPPLLSDGGGMDGWMDGGG